MKKYLIVAGTVLGVLLLVVVAAFAVGTPQAPPAAMGASGAGEVKTETPGGGAQSGSPLAIEIPGCVCHSDDPELVAEHATYRMSECAGCHAGGVPTGQK